MAIFYQFVSNDVHSSEQIPLRPILFFMDLFQQTPNLVRIKV